MSTTLYSQNGQIKINPKKMGWHWVSNGGHLNLNASVKSTDDGRKRSVVLDSGETVEVISTSGAPIPDQTFNVHVDQQTGIITFDTAPPGGSFMVTFPYRDLSKVTSATPKPSRAERRAHNRNRNKIAKASKKRNRK